MDKSGRQETAETRSGDDGCGGGKQQQQRQTTTATDGNGMQDWAADYDGEGWERAANNDGIKRKGRRR